MRTNEFLNEKVKERGLSIREFARLVSISESYASQILSPGSEYLPSDKLARRIVSALKFSPEEEEEFWTILEEDRKKLEEGPEIQPDVWEEIRRIKERLEDLEEGFSGVKDLGKEVQRLRDGLEEVKGKLEGGASQEEIQRVWRYLRGIFWWLGIITLFVLGILAWIGGG